MHRFRKSFQTLIFIFRSEDEDDYELSDKDLNKLLIVTQTSSTRAPKHEGHDRTGDWTTRIKMSQDLEQAINDGLFYYEEDLWKDGREKVSISQLLKLQDFNATTEL